MRSTTQLGEGAGSCRAAPAKFMLNRWPRLLLLVETMADGHGTETKTDNIVQGSKASTPTASCAGCPGPLPQPPCGITECQLHRVARAQLGRRRTAHTHRTHVWGRLFPRSNVESTILHVRVGDPTGSAVAEHPRTACVQATVRLVRLPRSSTAVRGASLMTQRGGT